MNDEAPPPAAPPSSPSAAAATASSPVAPAPGSAQAQPGLGLDWAGMLPDTVTGIALDVLKLAVLWAIVANGYAIWHSAELTLKIKIGGAVVAAGLVFLWKLYLALVEAKGERAIGATYLVLGLGACGIVQYFAQTAVDVTEGTQSRTIIRILGLAFLYPAYLGVLALKDGKVDPAMNPVGLPTRSSWFSTFWTLYAKEVRTFFTTAIPYVIYFVFLAVNGLFFWLLIDYFSKPEHAESQLRPSSYLLDNIYFYLCVWVIPPALTMRLVADEKRMGTIETLLTAPVTDVQVILSKFASAWTIFAALLTTTCIYLAILAQHSREWEWGPILAAYLGALLLGGFFIAVGLFYSTLTESQLIAFVLGFVTNFVLFLAKYVENVFSSTSVRALVRYLSIWEHYEELQKGFVSTKTLVFFLSSIVFFLFASVRGLETQKWK